ncbi:hypothetical protein CONPUDRAFT_139296 [Coniophora puteana RWD-64-598 SS2]|uniref:Uncharacterized protein n=1 Tax=Coniophora puteana (strain RWD-64-598) TaxID=741705 RepID=A0A5M3MDP9_CONPW|nr:uncharacterized protein CONPUDRAFT_139296 [Coniophora puteana RWD-64-598 SS2]EIW77392.1 hypothetical protein CONPUDRAFT_139296 [Coniophora puteana RWD-64-598 SS2]
MADSLLVHTVSPPNMSRRRGNGKGKKGKKDRIPSQHSQSQQSQDSQSGHKTMSGNSAGQRYRQTRARWSQGQAQRQQTVPSPSCAQDQVQHHVHEESANVDMYNYDMNDDRVTGQADNLFHEGHQLSESESDDMYNYNSMDDEEDSLVNRMGYSITGMMRLGLNPWNVDDVFEYPDVLRQVERHMGCDWQRFD